MSSMESFDRYWEDRKKRILSKPRQTVQINFDRNPNLSIPALKQNAENINNMTDEEIFNFITRSYKSLIRMIYSNDKINNVFVSYCFVNPRFLRIFNTAISQLQLDSNDIRHLNMVCYDYLTKPLDNEEVTQGMIQMNRILNYQLFLSLKGLGLDDFFVTKLTSSRFSCTDLKICVRRINFILITDTENNLDIQTMKEILVRLYNPMTDYIRILPYYMTDITPEFSPVYEDTYWVTEDVVEQDMMLENAMLEILEELPTQIIRNVLVYYANACSTSFANKEVKFSFRRLIKDFPRINAVVANVVQNEGIRIP